QAVNRRRLLMGRLYEAGAFPGKSHLWLQYVRDCPPPFPHAETPRRCCLRRTVCPFCWARAFLKQTLSTLNPAVARGDVLWLPGFLVGGVLPWFKRLRTALIRHLRLAPVKG